MDPDHDLICDMYPWFTSVMEDSVRDNYYDMLCGKSDDTVLKAFFNKFWECVPKHVWPIQAEVQYMWEDFVLVNYEPWIDASLSV